MKPNPIIYDPEPGSGFYIKISLHNPKTTRGKRRFYIKLYSDKGKKWKNIYVQSSEPTVSLTFQEINKSNLNAS